MITNKHIQAGINLVYDIVHDKELNYSQVMQTLLLILTHIINSMYRIEHEGM